MTVPVSSHHLQKTGSVSRKEGEGVGKHSRRGRVHHRHKAMFRFTSNLRAWVANQVVYRVPQHLPYC